MPASRVSVRSVPAALGADVACVLVFCALGRRSHAEGLTAAGVAETAWPFLCGTALGWVSVRGWKRPTAVMPTGLVVWLCTTVVAMLARRLTGAGTAASFVTVAATMTAALMLGWRALVPVARRRSGRRTRA